MRFDGRIENGVAVLEDASALPEGTRVCVEAQPIDSTFWENKSLQQLAVEQMDGNLTDVSQLAVDWPDEDPLDDLSTFVREVRR